MKANPHSPLLIAAGLLVSAALSHAQTVKVDINGNGDTTAAGWTGWDPVDPDNSALDTGVGAFAAAFATDGTADVRITTTGNCYERNYGSDKVTGTFSAGTPAELWQDQYFFNQVAGAPMVITLDDLQSGSYQFTIYNYYNNLPTSGHGGDGTAITDIFVNGVDSGLDAIAYGGSNPTYDAAFLEANVSTVVFTVANDDDTVTLEFRNPSARHFGLNGFQLAVAIPDATQPSITSMIPAQDATEVRGEGSLEATFDEPVRAATGDITIKNLSAGTETVIAVTDTTQVAVDGPVLTINPFSHLDPTADYAVRIAAGAVEDFADNPFAGILDDETWTFTTAARLSLAESLCAYLPLDVVQGQAGTLTTPEIINGHDFELVNLDAGNLIPGQSGMAFAFSAIDETMLTRTSDPGDALPISQNRTFTVSLWVDAASGQPDLRFFSEASTTDGSPLVNIGTNAAGGMIDIFARDAGGVHGGHDISVAQPLDGAGWRHVALVVDTFEMSFTVYIDGVADTGVFDFIDFYSPDINTTSIGGILRDEPTFWVTGGIDDVSLWKTVLSPEQIAELAAGVSPIDLAGLGAAFAITDIGYDPDADTVTLTWRSRPGATYKAFSSFDSIDWSNELADSLGPGDDLIGGDGNHLTVSFGLGETLQSAPDLFFRIEEE